MLRRLAALSGGLLLLCSAPLYAQNPVSQEMYGAGVHAYFSANYQRAHDVLTSVIASAANDPRALYFRGLTYVRLGREDEAKRDFQQGAKLEAKDLERTYNVSRALERIQGPNRMLLEQFRAEARALEFQRAEQLRKARYEALRREEERVLQQQAAGAKSPTPPPEPPPAEGPGVKPAPAPVTKQPPAPGPEPVPAGKTKVPPPPTQPDENPFEAIKAAVPGKAAAPATEIAPPAEKSPAPAKKATVAVPAPDDTDLFAPPGPGAKIPVAGPAEPGPTAGKKPAEEDVNPFAGSGTAAKSKSAPKKPGLSTKTPATKKASPKKAPKDAPEDADPGNPFVTDPSSDNGGAVKKTGP